MVDAHEYHERTIHTPESIQTIGDERMDPALKPRPYKVYRNLPRVSSPAAIASPTEPALSAIAVPDAGPAVGVDESPIDTAELNTLCHYATGVTKELDRRGGTIRFRAAACTGKLYHIDLYAVTGELGGIEPGVYHFDPDSGALNVLREGDYRGVLARASGRHPAIAEAPVTFVATSEWWRNAWKYGDRTYRHAFWDSGTILANLLAVAHGGGRPASAVIGFADDPVVELLGVDPDHTAPVELVPVGAGDPTPDSPEVGAIDPETVPVSSGTIDYPLIPEAWRQSKLADGDAVRSWRQGLADAPGEDAGLGTRPPGDGETVDLHPVDRETASSRPLGATIERRGSLREFAHDPISGRKFATVLDRALRGVPADHAVPGPGPGVEPADLLSCYCLVHAVEGIPSGTYQYHPDDTVLERVGPVDRATSAHLALGQSVVGDTAACVYLLADVETIVGRLGNRGYRLAQLAGGITLGRLYLATYAHRTLGGRGFTFFDDLVAEHCGTDATTAAPMTMFAFGTPPE